MKQFPPAGPSKNWRVWRCNAWHTIDGEVTNRPWFTYDLTPCPEHGVEFLQIG